RLKARAFMAYYTFIFPWQNHARDILPFYREGLDAGLAHGDFEYASYIMTLEALARLHTGEALADLEPDFERAAAKIKSLGHERSILLQNLLCQLVWALRHAHGRAATLSGRFYNEDTDLARCREPLDENLIFHHYLAKLTLAVFLGDPRTAVDAARRGRPHVQPGAFANYLPAMFVTYEALAELFAAGADARYRPRLGRVRKNLRQLRAWAASAPMNFAHKYHLVAAEHARYRGHGEDAAAHFERAIVLAQSHGFTHEAGLAQERAAAFYFARGMERLGRQYLRDSHASYRRWGADVVCRRLEAEYLQQFAILGAAFDSMVK